MVILIYKLSISKLFEEFIYCTKIVAGSEPSASTASIINASILVTEDVTVTPIKSEIADVEKLCNLTYSYSLYHLFLKICVDL